MIRVAIVGTGGMGSVHYHNYLHIEGCEVAALVDITPESAARSKDWNLPLYPSISEMVKHEKVDVVDVCTPTFLHKTHVMEGLENGLHAITEKPIALHKKDAEEMYALADARGKLLFVGQVLQFTKEVEVLRELVRNQTYGKVLDAYFVRLSACPRWVKNGWLFDRERSGLLPFDLHIHDLDLIISLFGKPESFAFTSCGNYDKNYKEHYRFNYNYDGFNVAAEAAWYNADFPFTANWRFYFENAVVVNDGTKVIAYQFDHEPHIFDTEETVKIPTGINLPPTGMFYAELSHFVNCIREGKPSELVTREQVLTVVELLEEISQKDG
jgi:predicted dehydrogenase